MSGRKRKMILDVPENIAGHPNETKSIIFKNGPLSINDFTNEFHSLPCRIEYNGPAKVSQYFITDELGDDTKIATFRGRVLNGVQQQFPDGYRLYIVVEKRNSDDNRVFEVSGSATSFMRWEYDRSANYQSPLVQAINYLTIAGTFAKDND